MGTSAQPGDCPSGTACWVTGASGPGLGDNDIDGGTTTLLSEQCLGHMRRSQLVMILADGNGLSI